MMPCPHDHMLQESSPTLEIVLRSSLQKQFRNYFSLQIRMLELKINETEFMTSRMYAKACERVLQFLIHFSDMAC